jgi:hypothetical protein
MRIPSLVAVTLMLTALGACKGKTKYKDSEATLQKVKDCEAGLKEKQEYIASLEKRIQEMEGEMVTVDITGEAMKVVGKGPNERIKPTGGNADDLKLYEAFVAALQRSHGSIQKCYQLALKNNATLQSRSVTLNIQVQYKTSGQVSASSFSPRIDQSFDSCMAAVAKRWTLPAMPRSVAFNYKQTLTPE